MNPTAPDQLELHVSRLDDAQVVLVHDYLTQRGGAERVALELARLLDVKQVVTSLYSSDHTYEGFQSFAVLPSFLQRVPVLRRDPRVALPLLPFAWSWRRAVQADVVVCSSSGWSHGVRVRRGARKIVYCHNPARWLYQADEYVIGASAPVRLALAVLTPALRWWDQRAARTVDSYIANSTAVARRIEQVYGRPATVIHPPVSVDVDGPREAVPGIAPGFFLTIGRGRGYKNAGVISESIRRVPGERLVVLGSSEEVVEQDGVTRLSDVSEEQLRWLYANARALVSVSFEDFGLTPVEAAAFGTPSLLLRAGGFLDSLVEGVTGCFVDDPSVEAVTAAIADFPREWDAKAIRASAQRFSRDRFADRLLAVVRPFSHGRDETEAADREFESGDALLPR